MTEQDVKSLFAEFSKKKPETKKLEEKREEKPKEEKVEPKEAPRPEPNREPEPTSPPLLNFLKPKEKVVEEVKPKEVFTMPVLKKKDEEFDLSPAEPLPYHIVTIYGEKGEGKTTLAFSFPRTHLAISFDRKTEPIRQQHPHPEDIIVFDGSRYLNKESADAWIESADRSWRYLMKLLDSIADDKRPDWIVIDGGEVFESIAEMTMRYRNNIRAFEGFANKNLWKERRMYIDQLLRKCIRKSKKGVIWTTYIRQIEVIEKGEFVAKKDAPRWVDAILLETDLIIRVDRTTGKSGQCFFATVESSKWPKIPESGRTEITGKGISALTKGEI